MAAAEARLLAEAIGVVRDRLQTGASCPGARPTRAIELAGRKLS
jgi:hypothetical protein